MSDLKPVRCGCGGEAILQIIKANIYEHWYRIVCPSCYVQTKAYYSEAEAIEVWNRAMGADKVDELMEQIWREKLDTRERIANLVERMLR